MTAMPQLVAAFHSLVGMAASSAYTRETLVAAGVGEPARVGPYRVTLRGMRPVIGDNWTALEARLEVQRGDGPVTFLAPQSRYFSNPPTTTSEAAIATRWDGQLYAVLGQPDGGGDLRHQHGHARARPRARRPKKSSFFFFSFF